MVESLEENIPKRVIEPVFPLEQDDEQLELETQEAGNWSFREDLIQTVGVAVGFCVFLLVLGGIIYLKCGNKRGGSLLVPFYNAQTQSVDLGTSRGGYGQLESYRHIIQPQPDEPADPAATAQPASDPAPPLHMNKSLEQESLQHQSPKQPARRGRHSIVSRVVRTK